MLKKIAALITDHAGLMGFLAVFLPATLLAVFASIALLTMGGDGPGPREFGLLGGVWVIVAAGGGLVAFLVGRQLNLAWGDIVETAHAVSRGEYKSYIRADAGGKMTEVGTAIVKLAELLDETNEAVSRSGAERIESELSQEKARFEAFLRGIGDCVTIVDADYRIIYVNDTVKKIFGDATGQFCYRFYEHKNEVCGGCPVKKSFETNNVETSLRRVYTKEDRLLYMENTGSPIRDEQGNIIAGIELARDVTQRIRLERSVEIRSRELAVANEELRIANEQLQAAYEELKAAQSALFQSEKMASLGVLVAGVAHEINNPINFVSGSMPLLQENVKALLELIDDLEKMELPDEARAKLDHLKKDLEIDYVKEDLEKIIRNVATGAQRVKEIVANLRTFSRVESGEQAEVNIHEGIDSTLEILKHEYKNKIEIHRDYGDIPHLLGSPGKLNQVFMNILHNAIQAIDGTGDIYIRTMQDDDKVVIEIQDTGKGIPEDKIPKIFDPFFTTKPVGEGTGLGLSISYSIIQDHRGRLTVDSRVGQGTTFRIELPTLKESSAA